MSASRIWTDKELAEIRGWYCQLNWTAAKIARRLGLSTSAVQARLRRAGIKNNKCPRRLGSLDKLVKTLHAKGLNDQEMADRIGELWNKDVYKGSIKRSRVRLGLSSNYDPIKHKEKRVAAIKISCEFKSPVSIRYEKERAESVMQGWPSATIGQRKFLLFLESVGEADVSTVSKGICYTMISTERALLKLKSLGWVDRKTKTSGIMWKLTDPIKEIRQRWHVENRERT